jgi:glucose-1-phosphatase
LKIELKSILQWALLPKVMDFSKIKNIIFDLGNVVIDIDPAKTYQAFANLSNSKNASEIEAIIKEEKLWITYETGLMTDQEFRELLEKHLDLLALDQEIDRAFNALLLDVEPERIDFIEKIGKKYRIFVLSNTSKIHMIDFEKIVERCTKRKDIWGIFEKPYFSYEMGKVKPNINIYEQVLSESNLLPEETLFIDDLKANIDAANTLNINTIHLQPPFTIMSHPLLKNLVEV